MVKDMQKICQMCPAPATKIYDFLYLGDCANADDLETMDEMGFTHVINCAPRYVPTGLEFYAPSTKVVEYIEFNAEDANDYNMMQHFPDAYDFIEGARKNKGKVLIHCVAGINRSGLLATAYYMVREMVGPITATRFVRSQRLSVLINKEFMKQLVQHASNVGLLELDRDKLELDA